MPAYNDCVGFIIHQRKYRDSSLIIDFFSKSHGKLSLIAKGITKNKNLLNQINKFSLLKIQFYGKSQLKTLISCDVLHAKSYENLKHKTAALYLNELITYSLLEGESSDELYLAYEKALENITRGKLSLTLRLFELAVLKHNGMELSPEANQNLFFSVNEKFGIQLARTETVSSCKVADIHKLLMNQLKTKGEIQRLNKFMSAAVDYCFNGKRIHSKELLKSLYN